MSRLRDELGSLRVALQERITDDFDEVLRRRRAHLRNRAVWAGLAVLSLLAGGATWAVAANHHDHAPLSEVTLAVPSHDRPCASPPQQLLTVDQAREQLGERFLLPSDPHANPATVDQVAVCSGSDIVVTFKSGVSLVLRTFHGKPPNWAEHAANDPAESELGSVHGQPAWIITPDAPTHRLGSVNFVEGGLFIIVVGNSHLSANTLQAIASSLPSAQITGAAADAGSCRLPDLAVSLHGVGLGAGEDVGHLALYNRGTHPCRLDAGITVTGLDRAGAPVTPPYRVTAAQPLLLISRTDRVTRGTSAVTRGAAITLVGGYHDPSGSGTCPTSQVIKPYNWQLTLAGQTITVRNLVPRDRQADAQSVWGCGHPPVAEPKIAPLFPQ